MFNVFVDSASDISLDMAKRLGLGVIPFYISFDSEKYYKEHIEISVEDFYKKLTAEKVFPKTSLPTQEDFMTAFRPSLERGNDVIHLSLTQKFSGAYQCALGAFEELKNEFPDRKIAIIDSTQAAFAEGLMALEAIRMSNAGLEFDIVVQKLKNMQKDSRVILTVDSLEYLQRGGRVGKLSALAGSLLNIKPIIVMETGELIPYGKVRGRKNAIERIINMSVELIGNKKDEYSIGVLHSLAYDEVVKLAETLKNVHHFDIQHAPSLLGTTIGGHIGPSVLGISFTKKYEFA